MSIIQFNLVQFNSVLVHSVLFVAESTLGGTHTIARNMRRSEAASPAFFLCSTSNLNTLSLVLFHAIATSPFHQFSVSD